MATEGDDDKEQRAQRLANLSFRVGQVFTPSAPIDQRSLFAGRIKELQKTIDTISSKGQHVVLYGERGVGKTSLATTVSQVYSNTPNNYVVVVRENCHSGDSYGKLWHRAFYDIVHEAQKPRVGIGRQYPQAQLEFNTDLLAETRALLNNLTAEPTPDEVVTTLRRITAEVVFIFDEFDQIADKAISSAFAETIKALSDYAVNSTVVLVGIGDSVDNLIASHASIERAIVQIPLPRMHPAELSEIVDKAMKSLGTTIDTRAKERIVRISQGLPHYVHLLGQHATRTALRGGSLKVSIANVDEGIRAALLSAQQSVTDMYLRAVWSPQKTNLFRQVLLACSLAATDDFGFFAAGAVRNPLHVMGLDLGIPAFASHLNKFTTTEHGTVLQKVGTRRRFRYRFNNPLLQPFVVMKGVTEKAIDIADVERLLSAKPVVR